MHFVRYWVPLALYCALIYLLSDELPTVRMPSVPHLDKALHLLEYALLGGLAIRAFGPGTRGRLTRNESLVLTLFFSTSYGALDEVHQSYVPGRDMDFLDLAADIAGATVAAWYYGRCRLRQPRSPAQPALS